MGGMVMISSATISTDKKYRYDLIRQWGTDTELVNWICLNPSTASATTDDPSIRRMMSFAKSWGKSGIVVTNLFAYRTPSPAELKKTKNPVGDENRNYIHKWSQKASLVVVAWGNHGTFLNQSQILIREWILKECYCLGTTNTGQPKHPLYIRSDTQLIPYKLPKN